MNISIEDTQKKLDKALKRNLENQTKSATTEISKSTSTELAIEEPISDNEVNDTIED